jgi:hypothetical protein
MLHSEYLDEKRGSVNSTGLNSITRSFMISNSPNEIRINITRCDEASNTHGKKIC